MPCQRAGRHTTWDEGRQSRQMGESLRHVAPRVRSRLCVSNESAKEPLVPPLTHQQMHDRIRRVMQARLGYDHLRPGQEAAIQSLLQGRDTLAIMPTGAGKSAQAMSC